MTFDAKITRWPTPFDASHGAEVGDLYGVSGRLRDLIVGTAGCSPYLSGALIKEQTWLPKALDAPETALQALLSGDTATGPELRRAKRRMALLVALADLGGVWDLAQVTGALTRFADRAMGLALQAGLAPLQARGKIPADPGVTLLAMGKMGAFELNYSSDIDMICLFDDSRYGADDLGDVRPHLIRATRNAMKLMSEVTRDGYVFRTDLRLRPDPSVTPICLSVSAAERYYESLGRAWERAAYIKARSCAGDISVGDSFLAGLTPFVWRRHLDFATIQDTHGMRIKIRENKGLHGDITLPDHDMKLGRGGIREIEFFTQTRQLIAGGRDPSLRARGTCDGLAALAQANWISDSDMHALTQAYRAHREVEHRLQMLRDAQTHSLPKSPEGMARLAAFMGQEQRVLEADLHRQLSCVHEITEGFFAPDTTAADTTEPTTAAPKTTAHDITGPAPDDYGHEITARWPSYPALRSERAVEIFERLRPQLLAQLAKAPDPTEALAQFDHFLAGLPSGVQVFSLFEANPQLLELLADIMATSPALAGYLARNAGVFDAVLVGDFFGPWPGEAAWSAALAKVLAEQSDYERQLDLARIWMKDWHFRIGVHHLRGLITGLDAGAHYADLARAVITALVPVVTDEFARKHGRPPGRGAVVVGMGSLGAGRIHAQSDLDLLLIYDAQGHSTSDGPRPLAVSVYFARLTQAIITALSSQTASGRLYEVDMRLRPSGRNGPVATSLEAFEHYQHKEAWTWEHLALTRAQVICGDPALGRAVTQIRADVLGTPRDPARIATDVLDLRRRLFDAKPGHGDLAVKDGPGWLQDIELMGQTCALLNGSDAHATQSQITKLPGFSEQAALQLRQTHRLLWRMQATLKLTANDSSTPPKMTLGARCMFERDQEGDAALGRPEQAAQHAQQIIEKTLAGWAKAPKVIPSSEDM